MSGVEGWAGGGGGIHRPLFVSMVSKREGSTMRMGSRCVTLTCDVAEKAKSVMEAR
jgi:hypothetical protein